LIEATAETSGQTHGDIAMTIATTISAGLLVGFSLTAATAAYAAGSEDLASKATAEQRAACTPDVFRLCAGDIPNVSKIVMCLKKERSKLSPGCKAVFAAN
jgi:hypothetical protein